MSNSRNNIFKYFALLSVLLVAVMSCCTIALASASLMPLVPFSQIKSYVDNGGKYDYIEYGRYPRTLIGEYDTSSEDDSVRVISSLILCMHEEFYPTSSLSSCYVSQFFPQTHSKITRTYSIGGASFDISYDPDSNYYTLGTSVGSYKAGTQIYTYNQAVDVFSKNHALIDHTTTRINDTSIGGIYLDSENVQYNDGGIYLFLVEPIRWRVLEKDSSGVITLMADDIIDSSSWYSGEINGEETFASSSLAAFINDMITSFEYTVTYEGRYDSNGNKVVDDGWVLGSDGYYESTNKGVHNTYVQCRVDFSIKSFNNAITIRCINYAELGYDFGFFSNIDSSLESSNISPISPISSDDGYGGESYFFSFRMQEKMSYYKNRNYDYPQDITYDKMADGSPITNGSHYFYVRYRKDTSVSNYNDSLKFKIVSPVVSQDISQDIYINQFFDKAFNSDEQNSVVLTTFSDAGNINCKVYIPTSNGSDGELDLAYSGLNIIENRLASITDYAKISGTRYDDETEYGEYWLRGCNAGEYDYVGSDGTIGEGKFSTKGLRPIVRVDLNKIDVQSFNEIGDSFLSGRISSLDEDSSSSSPVIFPSQIQEDVVLSQYGNGGRFSDAFPQYPDAYIHISYDFDDSQYVAAYSGFPADETGFLAMAYVPSTQNASIGAITPLLSYSSGTAHISRPISGKMYMYYISDSKIYSCIDLTEYPPIYLDPEHGDDSNNSLAPQTALKNLQTAISKAEIGQKIVVLSTITTSTMFVGRSDYSYDGYFPSSSTVTQRNINSSGHHVTLLRAFDGNLFSINDSRGVNISFNDITFGEETEGVRNFSVISTQQGGGQHTYSFDNVTAQSFDINGSGAFLHISGGRVYFRNNCEISDNHASLNGGAIWLGSGTTLQIENITGGQILFDRNSSLGDGGAIYSLGTVQIGSSNNVSANIYFRENSAVNGGAIYNGASTMYFHCVSAPRYYFERNSASSCGGVIYTKANIERISSNSSIVYMTGNYAGDYGGAIYVEGSGATVYSASAVLNGNHAARGGAIYVDDASVSFTLNGIEANGNYSTQGGGTLYCDRNLLMTGNIIRYSNRKYQSPYSIIESADGDGGAVFVSKDLSMGIGNTFTCNYSKGNGGAIYCLGTVSISTTSSTSDSNSLSGNKAEVYGGAIYAYNGLQTAANSCSLGMSTHTIGSTYYFNEATLGGGIYIENTGDISQFYNISFSGKSQEHGGGLYINHNNTHSTMTLTNCGASTCIGKQAGILYLDGKNLVIERTSSYGYDSYVADYSGYTATDGDGGAFSVNNGTVSIKNDVVIGYSIYINGWSANGSGGAIYCTSNVSLQVKGGNIFFSSNKSVGNGGAIYSSGNVSIKRTDFFEDSSDSYDIKFNSNTSSNGFGGAIYSAGTVEIDMTLSQAQSTSERVTLSSNRAQSGGAIYCGSSVTIRAGNSTSYSSYVQIDNNTATDGDGGGIYCAGNCSLITGLGRTDNYIKIYRNFAKTGTGRGGGIYCERELTFTLDYAYYEMYNNEAKSGGGVYSIGDLRFIVNSGASTSSNCYSNKATAGDGGMLYCESNIYVINNSTSTLYFGSSSGNSCASYKGGLVYAEGNFIQSGTGQISFGYSYIDNTSSSDNAGGAIYLYGGTLTLVNAEFNSCYTNRGKGGALYLKNAASLSGLTFADCYSGNYNEGSAGGAIYSTVPLALTNCSFSNCYSSGLDSGHGGAVYSGGTFSMEGGRFVSCYSQGGNGGAVYSASSVSISSVTFTSCYSQGGNGGAIYSTSSATLSSVTFTSCYSGATSSNNLGGGAVYSGGAFSMTGGSFNSCHCNVGNGGALYLTANSSLTDVSFTSCYCILGKGGAIFTEAGKNLTIYNTGNSSINISSCYASFGGAIYCGGNLRLERGDNSTAYYNITDNGIVYNGNRIVGNGGAICCEGTVNISGANIRNNGLRANVYYYYNNSTNVYSINNTYVRNDTYVKYGGAIYSEGAVTLVDVSLTGNQAEVGGAIYGLSSVSITEPSSERHDISGNIATSGSVIFVSSLSTASITITGSESYRYGSSETPNYLSSITNFHSGSNYSRRTLNPTTSSSIIYISMGDINVERVDFIASRVLRTELGSVTAKNATFTGVGVSLEGDGGAIYATGKVEARGVTFTSCLSSGNGGAVYCGYCEISDCIFDQCSSLYGSAVCTSPTILDTVSSFIDCTFTDNSSTGTAKSVSGLVCHAGDRLQDMSFERCLFEDNTSANGALLKVRNGCNMLVTNCIMLSNRNLQLDNSGLDFDIAQYTNRGGMFFVHEGGSLVIKDSVLSHNFVTSSGEGADVFVCRGGSLEIDNTYLGECVDRNITANVYSVDDEFYSIYAEEDCPKLSLSRIKVRNNNYGKVGAIFANSDVTIRDSQFSGNTSHQLIGVDCGTLTMSNCSIEGNIVSTHGTIYVGGEGKFMSFATSFVSNSSDDYGTAIYLDSSASTSSGAVASINNTLFSGNNTSIGAVVYVSHGALCSVSDSTFEDNNATASEIYGLCIYNSGTLSISNSLFTGHDLPSIEAKIYGGAICSIGEGSNLIVNDITVKDSDITDGQIYVKDSQEILEIRGLTLSNTVCGIVSNNAQMYLVDCQINNNVFSSPIIQLTGTGTLGIIGTTFANNEISSTSLIDISSAEDTALIMDNCVFSGNSVIGGRLLNLSSVGRVSMHRTIIDSNSVSMLDNAPVYLVYIDGEVVEIDSCEIVSNEMSGTQQNISAIMMINAAGDNVKLSSLSMASNSCQGATVLSLSIDLDSFVSLRGLNITDCEDMQAMVIDGKGSVKVEGSLVVSGCLMGVKLTSSANLELKHDLAISITDITLGEDSILLLDGVLDTSSSVSVLDTEVGKSVISTLSGSKLSSAYISSFHVGEGYVLAVDYSKNSAIIKEKSDLVTQDVVYNVSTKGYLVTPLVLTSEDFILFTPWEEYTVSYRLNEEEEYTSSSPQFSRVGSYTVYYLISSTDEEVEGSICVYLEPQSLHLKSYPVARVAYGSPVRDAVFTSYQVVNDEGISVGGRWAFSQSVPIDACAERILEQYEVIFTPYNTHVYGDATVSTSITLQIYFDELYYKNGAFAQSSSSPALEGIVSLSQALEYMTDYGSIHFLSTYVVSGMENISTQRSVYLCNDATGNGEIIRVDSGASLYLGGTTGKMIIEGLSSRNRGTCVIRNDGNLSLGRNLILRNFDLSSSASSAIYNVGSLILDGCDIYDMLSDIGVVNNNGGTVIISSGNFFRNIGETCSFINNSNRGELVLNGGSIYANIGSNILMSNGGSVFLNSGVIKNNQSSESVLGISGGCKLYLAGTHIMGNIVDTADITYDASSVIINMNSTSTITSSLSSPSSPSSKVDWSHYVLLAMLLVLCVMIFIIDRRLRQSRVYLVRK